MEKVVVPSFWLVAATDNFFSVPTAFSPQAEARRLSALRYFLR
jgi:hypothetical protein